MRISKYALKHLHSYPWVKLPDWLSTTTPTEPVAADYKPEKGDSSGRQYPSPEPAQDPTEYWRWLDLKLERDDNYSDETNDEHGVEEELVHSSYSPPNSSPVEKHWTGVCYSLQPLNSIYQ